MILVRGLDPGGHDAARAIVGDERYCFPADPGWPRGSGPKRHGSQHLGQDDPHLEGGEAGPQAPPDAAAEGEPSESRGRLAGEPVRPELGRTGLGAPGPA